MKAAARGAPASHPGREETARTLPFLVLLFAAVCLGIPACAQSRDPRLLPGTDPGGSAIALISMGIDYTDPVVAKMLARDGEGDLIGWDFVDNDNRPFDVSAGKAPAHHGGNATDLVKRMSKPPIVRIVPVRVDPTNARHLADALEFVARTPARIVLVPMWSGERRQWELFERVASARRELLLILAAGDEGFDLKEQPVWPAASRIENALVANAGLRQGDRVLALGNRSDELVDLMVAAAETSGGAAVRIAVAAVCAVSALKAPTSASVKQSLMERAIPNSTGGSRRVHREAAC